MPRPGPPAPRPGAPRPSPAHRPGRPRASRCNNSNSNNDERQSNTTTNTTTNNNNTRASRAPGTSPVGFSNGTLERRYSRTMLSPPQDMKPYLGHEGSITRANSLLRALLCYCCVFRAWDSMRTAAADAVAASAPSWLIRDELAASSAYII